MLNQKQVMALLKEYKQNQAARFGVTKMGVFGSVARWTSMENSDIFVELSKRNLLNRIGLKMSPETLYMHIMPIF